MNIKKVLLVVIGLALTMAGGGWASESQMTRVAADAVTWSDTPFGVQASAVEGDFLSGKHITFIKFKAGTATPVHVHSHDYVGIVVQGRSEHYEPGKPETETVLAPGSHWFVPANVPHISACLPGEDCIFALYQDDAFDFIPQE